MRAVMLSDIHLGSRACRAAPLLRLLSRLERRPPDVLVLAGDTFENLDFRRLPATHQSALAGLRRLEEVCTVVWLAGNHDGPAHVLSAVLGRPVHAELLLESGGQRFLCLHGHLWDPYLNLPWLTWLGDVSYAGLLRVDPSRRLAAWAKRRCKHYLRCLESVRTGAEKQRDRRGVNAVLCGHTHSPAAQGTYFNAGSWTERPATYLEVVEGVVEVRAAG